MTGAGVVGPNPFMALGVNRRTVSGERLFLFRSTACG
jgi:hypothetical protein